ncbi:hypothetical protein RyT2_13360 [Pseudolactococcus yaeyamensis]
MKPNRYPYSGSRSEGKQKTLTISDVITIFSVIVTILSVLATLL